MTEVVKENIQHRLNICIAKEGLKVKEAAACLGIGDPYVSLIKNSNTWNKVGITVWEIVLKWVNSGQGLKEYSEKKGRVLYDKQEAKPGTIISRIIKKESINGNSNKELKQADSKIRLRSDNLPDNIEAGEIKIHTPQSLKCDIDIEINIYINGKKINI